MKLYLVRHGQSEANAKNHYYGSTDSALTLLGREQAAQVGEKMRHISFARCYTSLLARAHDTALAVLEGREEVPVVRMGELNEQGLGDFEGFCYEELFAKYPQEIQAMERDWIQNAPRGGESYMELSARVERGAQEILAREEDALIVAHNGSLSVLMVHLLQLTPDKAQCFFFQQGCFSIVEVQPRGLRRIWAINC